jgi:mannose-6-phosphate isomerase
MTGSTLYPLRFDPIYQYRLWGGRRLADWLPTPLPGDEPIGEAWLLSDRHDYPSRVAEGPLKGRTISELIQLSPELMLGKRLDRRRPFPLLLKFLDVQKMLSVQVHPADGKDNLIPIGETGKTEAWIVLEARTEGRIFAGLKAGATAESLRTLSKSTVDASLASFRPARGQAILIDAGTVHALGDGVVVFEVQENSDVTYRLYDWDHDDPRTGRPRELQVEKALDCVDMGRGAVHPSVPLIEVTHPYKRERLFDNPHFRVWRLQAEVPFPVGAANEPRILVCLEGNGSLDHEGVRFTMQRGTVMLLPAVVGACRFHPECPTMLLDVAGPVPS